MIRWNLAILRQHMKAKGIANANQLADAVGLTIPTAYLVLSPRPVKRIPADVLEALADYFGVEPWTLLKRTKS